MNLYFLVEGASTEKKFYPALVNAVFEEDLKQVKAVNEVDGVDNRFYVLSANGYPQIYSHILKNTIEDINSYPHYNFLFICLDADELTIQERKQEFDEIYGDLTASGTVLNDNCEIVLIVQNRCIETWFLGNKKFYRRSTTNHDMRNFHFFYNVMVNDPEDMGFDNDYETHASFHYAYLKQMIRENRETYSKKNAKSICKPEYIANLINRNQIENHLQSFGILLTKLLGIRDTIRNNRIMIHNQKK